ncbi:MAG TPA: hypothetical protein VNT51_01905 [Miltoncostaeaceae bacterium]|nr:hypothetical protein [Miltoncostaeaceae bacterium]
MPSVPDTFWLPGSPPRPVPVTSVTPSRIYLTLDGDGVNPATIELDREAWVEHGRILIAGGHDSMTASVFATEAEARADQALEVREQVETAEARVRRLKGEISRLEDELEAAKKARKQARKALKKA